MPVKPTDNPRRGRPARIDRDGIVAAAIDLGLDTFSLDDISHRLGVSTPALYRHVDGRDDIVRSAAASVILGLEPRLATIDAWDEWVRAWTNAIRDELGAVGEEVLAAVRTTIEPGAVEVADHGLRLLVAAGLTPADAAYTLWLALRIACTSGPAGRPSVTAPLAQVSGGPAPSAEMADAIDSVAEVDGADSWRFDLDVLIAGVGARLG